MKITVQKIKIYLKFHVRNSLYRKSYFQIMRLQKDYEIVIIQTASCFAVIVFRKNEFLSLTVQGKKLLFYWDSLHAKLNSH